MRVLVAGATGVVGRQLVPLLGSTGHEVIALSRSGRAEAGVEAEPDHRRLPPDRHRGRPRGPRPRPLRRPESRQAHPRTKGVRAAGPGGLAALFGPFMVRPC
ncbi:NAD-dependent epimerase/dehydratase family protein [Spirillospora sp. NPDC029432]|uniref:NAD-dependent epimerase/dehydratase family protein n=1 Tax=Spirillospora sp. NPDC029432 TaxID=3154599 RepID=UPI003453E349